MSSYPLNKKPMTARPGRRRARGWQQTVQTLLGISLSLILVATLAAIGYGVYLVKTTTQALPATDSLIDYLPGGVTELFSTDKDPATGQNYVLGRVYSQYKVFAPITEIPQTLQDATIAIEDERFYNHAGIDLRGTARAIYKDVVGHHMGEGGSTLTQQLARNIFLNQNKTLNRKLKEAILAIELEKNFSKEQILEMYLNEVCYGNNTYGVRAAARTYFGKPLAKLTIAESALLAGLPQSPTDHDPFRHIDSALRRRNEVIAKLREQHYITPEQATAAFDEKPKLIALEKRHQTEFKAPYFSTYILRQLIAKYGVEEVYKGGLKVYTTLNYQMQLEGERALVNGVQSGADSHVSEGALVALEPRTGYIRAMVGGVDYKNNQYNNVTQGRRQPGSSFKVFVYTTAFMLNPHRFDPDTVIEDSPVTFGKYSPKNYEGRFEGGVTIREALAKSINVPAVKVANMIGIRNVIQTARLMGITSKLEPNLSLALGSNAVTPLEMASAYSVFPNHGSHAEPMGVIRVVDGDGKTLENNAPQVEQAVIPESVVANMSSMLRTVVEHGTAAGAKGIQEVEDAHGKTGTTNENRDAWFIGYTPELTTAVWVAGVKRITKNGKITSTRYVPMTGITGGHICAPIWARFMLAAVPLQRQSGEPIQGAPEKTVPRNVEAVTTPRRADASPVPDTAAAAAAEPPIAPTPTAAPSTTVAAVPVVPTAVASTPTAVPPAVAPAALRVIATPRPTPTPVPDALADGESTVPAPHASRLVTVLLCEETGQRATRWCPTTVTRTMPADQAPRGYCRKHRAQPGDR
jgi:penicillin-binding protein 1A